MCSKDPPKETTQSIINICIKGVNETTQTGLHPTCRFSSGQQGLCFLEGLFNVYFSIPVSKRRGRHTPRRQRPNYFPRAGAKPVSRAEQSYEYTVSTESNFGTGKKRYPMQKPTLIIKGLYRREGSLSRTPPMALSPPPISFFQSSSPPLLLSTEKSLLRVTNKKKSIENVKCVLDVWPSDSSLEHLENKERWFGELWSKRQRSIMMYGNKVKWVIRL